MTAFDRSMTGDDEFRDELEALARRVQTRKTRPCLCCGATFESEGAHNRLCERCREGRDPLGPDQSVAGLSIRG